MRHGEQRRQVFAAQSVTGIDLQAERMGLFGARNQAVQFRRLVSALRPIKFLRELAGVQLDELRAGPRAGCNLLFIRRDEQAHLDAGGVHFPARLGQGFFSGNHIKSAFRRHFQPPLRNDTDDFRLQLQRDGDDLRRVRHFEVQPRFDFFAQRPDIAVLSVPAILAQMGGDAVRARRLGGQRRRHRTGFAMAEAAITRLANGGDMVNVNAEFKHEITSRVPVPLRVSAAPAAGDAGASDFSGAAAVANHSGESPALPASCPARAVPPP